MQLDAETQGKRWLEQAEADRRGAQLLYDGESYHLTCFIAQQVAAGGLSVCVARRGWPRVGVREPVDCFGGCVCTPEGGDSFRAIAHRPARL